MRAPAAFAVAALVSTAAIGCGAEVPAGGARLPRLEAPKLDRRLDASDLFPSDLDLVIRIDVARMRAGLGPDASDALRDRAFGANTPHDAAAAWRGEALAKADVVWLALRLVDLDHGDRIVVAEGRMGPAKPNPAWFEPIASLNADAAIFDAREPARRDGVGRVIALGDRALAFVSPAEMDAVARVLSGGPDEERGDPQAEGIVSVDFRAHRLPPTLERAYPSIGGIIAGVDRVRGVVGLSDDHLLVEAQVACRSPGDAEKVLRFLSAFRDLPQDPQTKAILADAEIERIESSVRVRWPIPAAAAMRLVGGGAGAVSEPGAE